MERRLSKRKSVSHEVILYYSGVGMLRCQTRDVSMDGAFLEMQHVSIPTASEVELALNVVGKTKGGVVRFGGQVVRSGSGGVGVNFTKFFDGAHAYLKQLVNE